MVVHENFYVKSVKNFKIQKVDKVRNDIGNNILYPLIKFHFVRRSVSRLTSPQQD